MKCTVILSHCLKHIRGIMLAALPILLLFCGVAWNLSGCSYFKPYHVSVQQGNILDAKLEQQLAVGMSKNEVEDILGTPVLRNDFADNYWTYIYTNQINGGKIEKKQLELYFSGNKLVKVEKKNI